MRGKHGYLSPSLRTWALPIPIRVERVRILEETNGNRTLRIGMLYSSLGTRRTLTVFAFLRVLRVLRVFVVNALYSFPSSSF